MIGPGSLLLYVSDLDKRRDNRDPDVVEVCCRKADGSGWWTKDGGGLSDKALGEAWREITVRPSVATHLRGCARAVPRG